MSLYKISAALLLFGSYSIAQSFSIGVIGGLRTTDDVSGHGIMSIESRPYVVGPAFELGLPLGLGVEFDALYHREGYRTFTLGICPFGCAVDRERSNSWEFPLLLKYKLPVKATKPYLEVGYAHRVMSGFIDLNGLTENTNGVIPFHDHVATHWDSSNGFVAGGGIQFDLGPFHIAPGVRYTKWGDGGPNNVFWSWDGHVRIESRSVRCHFGPELDVPSRSPQMSCQLYCYPYLRAFDAATNA
ncbi:MAG TPA: hypothetical protein VK687_03650 [Bryobacteraceae bacterium]|nr:hypothetical protein [Bryobacteraceae bacterium]